MWENDNVASSYLFCNVQQGFWKLVIPKIVFLCRWICLCREDRSFNWRYGLKNSLPFAQITHTSCNVCLEMCRTGKKTSVFSSGLFVVCTQCGPETLRIGDPLENLCDRSAFDFAPWSSVLFYFLLSNIYFFLYKSEFLVQGWGSLFCDTLKPDVNVA